MHLKTNSAYNSGKNNLCLLPTVLEIYENLIFNNIRSA